MTYDWNSNKIKNQLIYLKKLLVTADQDNLENINDAIYYLEYICDPKTDNHQTSHVNSNCDFSKYIDIVSDASRKITSAPFYELKHQSIIRSEEEVLEQGYNFYKSLNNQWYNLFLKIYKEKNHNIRFTSPEKGPIMYHIPHINYCYLSFRKTNDVREESDIVHEYAHAISSLINPNESAIQFKQIFLEVPSLFMELASQDFFKSRSSNPLEYDIHQKYLFDTMLLYFDEVYLDNCFNLNKAFKYKQRSYMMANNVNSKINRFSYAISYLIAVELLYIYNKDKDKALLYLNEIIKIQNKTTWENKLDSMNINPGENIKNYQQKILSKIKKAI